MVNSLNGVIYLPESQRAFLEMFQISASEEKKYSSRFSLEVCFKIQDELK